jgi:hypothetical protein
LIFENLREAWSHAAMLQALKQLYLTGINSQAAIHGADTETMIGSNAPTRIKTTSGNRSVRPILGIDRI